MKHVIKFKGNDKIRIEVHTNILDDKMVLNGQMRTAPLGTQQDPWETFCVENINLNDEKQVGKGFEVIISEFHDSIIDKYQMYSDIDSYLKGLSIIDFKNLE